ncbi:hypothetical protein MMC30_008484 [Trapelia coarctata]|nr:hypothetical protein [Trapelia coarctata]
MRNILRWGAVYALASTSYAQIIQYPAQSNVQYSFNVPAASASSGNGDIYFQIQAPASTQWVGLGQGSEMKGANIFIVYSDSDGQNVTISPRLGLGNFQPQFNSQAQVSLLEGSGISNGMMTANVRCSSCTSWSGGSMSLTDPSSSWIWSIRAGDAIASNSQSADLQQHNNFGTFKIDLTKATGGNSVNPFVQSSTSTNASGTAVAPLATTTAGSSGDGGEHVGPSPTKHMRVVAHGVLMSLAFLIFFPFGALTVRLLSFKGLVWVHAGTQLTAYAIAVSGMGIGVWLAVTEGAWDQSAHTIFGLVIIALLFFQPILGLIHHMIYQRSEQRTLWCIAHIWFGRVLIILGVINGGLGLQLSDNTVKGEIAYGVIAGVFFLFYVAVVVISDMRGRGKKLGETGEKITGKEIADQSPNNGDSTDGLNRGR